MNKPFEHGYYHERELREFGIKSVGVDVQIAKNCTIIGLEHISVGNHVRIDGFVTLIASQKNPFSIGSYIHIGPYTHICGSAGFVMQDFSALSAGVRIFTRSDDFSGAYLTNPTVPARYTNVTEGQIEIGRHAIVGGNAVVLPGANVAEGCAVGTLSSVHKSLEPWGVYFGSPARRIGNRSNQLLDLEQELLNAA